MSPVAVSFEPAQHGGQAAKGNLLGFNDFHGAIDPPTGSGGLINGVPAGGVEYLATWVKKLRAEAQAEGRRSITVGAGDLVGATPLVSAAFHDEPTIELMNSLGLQISSVGNHEFDEGTTELLRLQRGGCHPTDGCQDGDGFDGADFTLPGRQRRPQEHRPADAAAGRHPAGRRRAGRLRRHDAGGHPEHREPGRNHHRRVPRRGGDGQHVDARCSA